ncbi:hypothetical protein [Acinetobacter phage pB23]|nr:hypothetical protein [Acinetobacter phage pB23]
MAEYDNRNSGVLFPNDRKTKQSHPDYKGSMTDANGQEFWISAWVKPSRNGKGDYLSLAFEKKEDRPADGPRTLGSPKGAQMPRHTPAGGFTGTAAPAPADLDDDLPF